MKNIIILLLSLLLTLIQIEIISTSSVTIQLRRPRQFLMDIYTRPNRKGLVQHIRLDPGAGI